MKYLIILITLLAGCSGGGSSDESTKIVTTESAIFTTCSGSIFYGDSIGKQLRDSGLLPWMDFDTYGGRTLMHLGIGEPKTDHPAYTFIDYSYCNIYIALGTNTRGDEAATELHFMQLLEGHRDKIICVLPMTWKGELIAFREVMKRECSQWIDPIQFGVYPLNIDGVHLSINHSDNVEHYAALFTL